MSNQKWKTHRRKGWTKGVAYLMLVTVPLLTIGGCPRPSLIAKELCWTSFTGMPQTTVYPLKIGTINLASVADTEVFYRLDGVEDPFIIKRNRLEGTIEALGTKRLPVTVSRELIEDDTDDQQWLLQSIRVAFKSEDKSGSHVARPDRASVSVVGALRPWSRLAYLENLVGDLGGSAYRDALPNSLRGLPIGKLRYNSNPLLALKTPSEIVQMIAKFRDLRSIDVAKLFEESPLEGDKGLFDPVAYPCGDGPNGYTVCPDIAGPLPGEDEDWVILSQVHDAEIPIASQDQFYQFGFVFDADGDPDNNYVPLEQFANDFFQDTDLWYSVEYTPSGGWRLIVTDARNNVFTAVASAARAIITGNTILIGIPASEFSAGEVGARMTSFCHGGDFGQNPPFDWSADYYPDFDEVFSIETGL
jgi:hypothetical protein